MLSCIVYLKELVLEWSKGANQMSEVVGDDDDVTPAGVLRSQHGQSPRNHTNLERVGERSASEGLLAIKRGLIINNYC